MATPDTQTITHSRMKCFRLCPRKHHLRYNLKLVPDRESDALSFGKAYHLGLKALNNGFDWQAVELAVRDAFAAVPGWIQTFEEAQKWWYQCETCVELLRGHHARYANDGLRTVAAELAFELPLINPDTAAHSRNWVNAGVIDRLVAGPLCGVWVQEYKTAGVDCQPGTDYWLRLRMDSQVSHYVLAARNLGHDIAGVIYDVTRKPTIRPCDVSLTDDNGDVIVLDANGERVYTKDGRPRKSADSAKGYVVQTRPMTRTEWAEKLRADIEARPDFYYVRQEVARLDADIAEHQQSVWQQARMIRESQLSGHHPKNDDACFVFSKCEYFGICTSGVVVTEDSVPPQGFKRAETAHAELVESAELVA